MRKSNPTLRQIAAWAGMIGPLLFVGVFTLEGSFRPGYNPSSMYISELSLGLSGWIQRANFILLGVLLLVFTLGIAAEFPTGKASRGGILLMTLIAILFLVSGPFVMDPTGTPLDQATLHGTIHGLAGGFVFLLMPIICFVFLRRFRVDPNWQSFQLWTITLGIIEALGVLFFTIVSKSPQAPEFFTNRLGLIQRIALIPFMFWLFLFGLEMLGRSKQG